MSVGVDCVGHSINLVRLAVVWSDYSNPFVVDIWRIEFFKELFLGVSIAQVCLKLLEDAHLVDKLCAAIHVEENTLGGQLNTDIVAWPRKKLKLSDFNFIFS